MSVVVFVLLWLATVVFWRQVAATLLAVVVLLVVLGAAVALHALGAFGAGPSESSRASAVVQPWV